MPTVLKVSRFLADVVAFGLAALAIYVAGFGVFDEVWVRAGTVGLALMVSLLSFSRIGMDDRPDTVSPWTMIFNATGLMVLAVTFYLWITIMLAQEEAFVDITQMDYLWGYAGSALVFLLTLRHFGMPLLIVCLGAFFMIVFGHLLPGGLAIPDFGWARVSENIWYSFDGVFGRPVAVVGQIVLIFIVFGAVLESSGAGATLLKFAFALTGRMRGGPAHAAIVGSAMFGTLNGAAVANVVSTGVFTIPMIKRTGLPPKFAGAVEAAASTGGQIMPPVMGAVAFLMADVTGIPYLDIVVAAAIPALMYYFSLFSVVWLEARKQGISPIPPAERSVLTAEDWVRSVTFFVPLSVIVYVLLTGRTAQAAGFFGLVTAFALALALYPEFRSVRRIVLSLVAAGRTAATIMIVVAAIGFVVGAINMSGLGLKFAAAILTVAGDSLFLSLVMVMVGSLVLGMGVPVGAAYLIIVLIIGPALGKLGLSILLTHLFVVYYGVLSAITPPVAVAAFAAAPIAGSKPIETGFVAVRLAAAGFLIPFIFIYHPSVVLIENFVAVDLAWAIAAFAVSTAGVVTALAAYSLGHIGPIHRVLRLAGGIVVLVPDIWYSMGAAAVVATSFLAEAMAAKKTIQKHLET